jgi:YD repeat-containing protein
MSSAAIVREARKNRGELDTGPRKSTKRAKTEENIQEDIAIYKERMSGQIYEELAKKYGQHHRSIQLAVERGEKYAKERGIDVDYVKIRINDLFNETLGALAKDIAHQSAHGQEILDYDGAGNLIGRRVAKGISSRTAGELTRSLARWADFCGVSSGNAEGGGGNVTLVQLNMPSDGAAFDGRWQGGDEGATLAAAQAQLEPAAALVPAEVIAEPAEAPQEAAGLTIDVSVSPEPATGEKPTGQARRRARVAAAERVLSDLLAEGT